MRRRRRLSGEVGLGPSQSTVNITASRQSVRLGVSKRCSAKLSMQQRGRLIACWASSSSPSSGTFSDQVARMRQLHLILGLACQLTVAATATAQPTTLKCEPEKSLMQEALCSGDQRYCARYLEVDTSKRTVAELNQGTGTSPQKWKTTAWSETHIERRQPSRRQHWPNGALAYEVETIELLNRFTGELTLSHITRGADARVLDKESALQIVNALGAGLKVVPLAQTTTYSCTTVQRAF